MGLSDARRDQHQTCRCESRPRFPIRSGRTMARTGLRMMPTSPSSPLRFRTAGFPQYGSKAGLSDGAFPAPAPVKPAPGIPIAELKFASILHALRRPRLSPLSVGGPDLVVHRHAGDLAALPQGPSLRSGLCCPDPSSLNRRLAQIVSPSKHPARATPAAQFVRTALEPACPHAASDVPPNAGWGQPGSRNLCAARQFTDFVAQGERVVSHCYVNLESYY
jgi:hypothetical protein